MKAIAFQMKAMVGKALQGWAAISCGYCDGQMVFDLPPTSHAKLGSRFLPLPTIWGLGTLLVLD